KTFGDSKVQIMNDVAKLERIEKIYLQNGKFLLKSAIDSLNRSVELLGSPSDAASDCARKYISDRQSAAITTSFLARSIPLKEHIIELRRQFNAVKDIAGLRRLQRKIDSAGAHFLRTEKFFDYYTGVLNTRSEGNMGLLLRGCDTICTSSLKKGLE